MVEESTFRGMVGLLERIGVYDVILPFLLVFTIVFAILEKTKIFGVDKLDGGQVTTKKNINAIVAFVVAFLVIASTKLVSVINEVMANVVLLLVLAVCFLLLIGSLFADKEFSMDKFPTWTNIFLVLMFLGIVVIFLNALDWLHYITDVLENWNADWAASIIFIVIIIGFMIFITWDSKPKSKEAKKE